MQYDSMRSGVSEILPSNFSAALLTVPRITYEHPGDSNTSQGNEVLHYRSALKRKLACNRMISDDISLSLIISLTTAFFLNLLLKCLENRLPYPVFLAF